MCRKIYSQKLSLTKKTQETFETLITILTIENLNDNICDLTIKCNTGQHSKFLRRFSKVCFEILFQASIFPPLRWSVYCILPGPILRGKYPSSIKQSNALNILLLYTFCIFCEAVGSVCGGGAEKGFSLFTSLREA